MRNTTCILKAAIFIIGHDVDKFYSLKDHTSLYTLQGIEIIDILVLQRCHCNL
jgi:hypothetical protein